jgi:hypothetical protein
MARRQPARVQLSGVTGTGSTGKDVAVHVNFGDNVDTRVGWIMREEILQKAYDALESAGRPRCHEHVQRGGREDRVNLNFSR